MARWPKTKLTPEEEKQRWAAMKKAARLVRRGFDERTVRRAIKISDIDLRAAMSLPTYAISDRA